MTGRPFQFSFDIAKVDAEQRRVWGYATVEQPDKQGDIVDYQASIDAFRKWPGNIREQHNKQKAVGVCVGWEPMPEKKAIWVGAQLSKSRDGEDAWTKIQEGVLKGFSIGGEALKSRAEVVKSGDSEKTFNRITKYRLDELSLVDNPACPDATICLVKSASGGVSVPTEVIEKVQVTTTGAAAMDLNAGSMSQRGTTPPQPAQVLSDDSNGQANPSDDKDSSRDGLDPGSVADANLTSDAPAMPTPDTAKPNGLMDQRGKPIDAGGTAIGAAAGDVDNDAIAKAVLAHLQEQNAALIAKTETGSPARLPLDTPAAPTAPAAQTIDIASLAKQVGDILMPAFAQLLKETQPPSYSPPGKKKPKADDDDDADDDGTVDNDNSSADPGKGKAAGGLMEKGLYSAADVEAAVLSVLATREASMNKAFSKSLEDAFARGMTNLEGQLAKAVQEPLSALEKRVAVVETMPAYPANAPAVRAVDKALGVFPAEQPTSGLTSDDRAVVERVFKSTSDPRLRERAGYSLALDEIKAGFR